MDFRQIVSSSPIMFPETLPLFVVIIFFDVCNISYNKWRLPSVIKGKYKNQSRSFFSLRSNFHQTLFVPALLSPVSVVVVCAHIAHVGGGITAVSLGVQKKGGRQGIS